MKITSIKLMNYLTFIIPVFNEARTLEKAINEVLEINDIEKELIIIDNNSSDGSKEIIKKYSSHKNIKIIIKSQNLGYGDTIKKGIKLATGDLIYIQYADLEYDISSLFDMINNINKNNHDFIFGERYQKLNDQNSLKKIINRPAYLGTYVTTNLINYFYKKKFNDIIGSKLYKTSKIREITINSNGQGFDFELVSKICKKNYNVGKTLVKYEPRKNSKEKKIKFYHIFVALFEIFKVKFFY